MRSHARSRSLPMSTLAFALVGSLFTVGCAGFAPASFGPERGETPLRVWVAEDASFASLHGGSSALIHLSRPAHVAIFDIRPGFGVRAVYPATDLGGTYLQHAGLRMLQTFGSPFRSAAFIGGGCWASWASPVSYRVVVASDRPLRLGALRGDVDFPLRPGVRSFHFASGTAFRIMDRIVYALLPGARPDGTLVGGGEWDIGWNAEWVAQPCRANLLQVASTLGDTPGPETGPPNSGEVGGDDDDARSRDREAIEGFAVPERPVIEYPVAGRVAVEPAGGETADGGAAAEGEEPVREGLSTTAPRQRERPPLVAPRVRDGSFRGIRSGLNRLHERHDRPKVRFRPHSSPHRLGGGLRRPGVRAGQRPTTRPRATSPRPTRERSSSRPVRKSSSSGSDRADRPGGR